jgi:uncharacterized protein (TIGR02246 family)
MPVGMEDSMGSNRDLKYVLDYLAIRDLCARYNRYADAGDGEGWASVFTEDGVFEMVGVGSIRGRQALAAQCAAYPLVVHTTTDPLVEVNGDEAQQSSRMIAHRRAADGSAVVLLSTGMVYDDLVRTADGWRIKKRRSDMHLNMSKLSEIAK